MESTTKMTSSVKVKCETGEEFLAPPLIINFRFEMDVVFEVCTYGFISPFTGEIISTHEFPVPNIISEEKCQELFNSTNVDEQGNEVDIIDNHIIYWVNWYKENNMPFPAGVYVK